MQIWRPRKKKRHSSIAISSRLLSIRSTRQLRISYSIKNILNLLDIIDIQTDEYDDTYEWYHVILNVFIEIYTMSW